MMTNEKRAIDRAIFCASKMSPLPLVIEPVARDLYGVLDCVLDERVALRRLLAMGGWMVAANQSAIDAGMDAVRARADSAAEAMR